jgi:hypothetical protein
MADAVLITPAEQVELPPCPFQKGDVIHHKGREWQISQIAPTDWMGYHADLLEPDARPGDWSVEWVEWACDEPPPFSPLAVAGQPEGTTAPPITAEIVPDGADRLAELEERITEGLSLIQQGRDKIWAAAVAVRDEKLWQIGDHASFETYCETRWGWGRSNAFANAQAGEVLAGLKESRTVDSLIPESTAAMVALAQVEPEQRPAVLQKIAATGATPTAKAVRDTAEAELRSAGIPVYRPDTSDEAIREGLASGYLRPTSAASVPTPAASPATDAQTADEQPAPFDEALRGSLEPGRFVKVATHPGVWYLAQLSPDGQHAMVWSRSGHQLVPLSDLVPNQFCDPASLNRIALDWLSELVGVLGAEQVQTLLGEVAK